MTSQSYPTMHETNRQHDIRACLARLATQYDRATSQHRMSATDREKMRCWFEDRYAYLQEEYRLAINEADNIIGKQWLFDHRPVLLNA